MRFYDDHYEEAPDAPVKLDKVSLDEISKLEIALDKINKHIKMLWECVIKPYTNNSNARSILECEQNIRDKFINFIYMNNPEIGDIIDRLHILKNETPKQS